MSDFVTKGEEYMALVQSLLEGKKMARSLENLADSIAPLCTDDGVSNQLTQVIHYSKQIADILTTIYKRNAKEAFGGILPLPTGEQAAKAPPDISPKA